MSGEARNNIEFPARLAEFFDSASREAELIQITLNGQNHTCLLRSRGFDYNQYTYIWRLALPTQQSGGVLYAGRVVKMDIDDRPTGVFYKLTVADHGSTEHLTWRAESAKNGVVDTTGGGSGREYGYW